MNTTGPSSSETRRTLDLPRPTSTSLAVLLADAMLECKSDGPALSRLLVELEPHLLRFLKWRYRRNDRCDEFLRDVLQEALFKIAQHVFVTNFVNESAFMAWCRRVTHNTARDCIRQARYALIGDLIDANARNVRDPDARVLSDRDDDPTWEPGGAGYAALKAYAALSTLEAELVWSHLILRLEWREASQVFGKTPKAAKNRYQRVLQRLRLQVLGLAERER